MATQAKRRSASKAQPAKESGTAASTHSQLVAQAQSVDLSQLPAEMRVYELARLLEAPSNMVVAALADQGISKKAQSKLVQDEVVVLLTALRGQEAAAGAPAEETVETPAESPAEQTADATSSDEAGDAAVADAEASQVADAEASQVADAEASQVNDAAAAAEVTDTDPEATDRLKHRVTKAVENEIHQIQDKVNAQLAAQQQPGDDATDASASTANAATQENSATDEQTSAGDEATAKVRHRVEKAVENEIHQIEQKVEAEVTALQQQREEQLTNELALAQEEPADAPEEPAQQRPAVPLFVAPTVATDDQWETQDWDEDLSDSGVSKRRGKRGQSRGKGQRQEDATQVEQTPEVNENGVEVIEAPKAIQGSTRLEAQRRRRIEMREEQRNKRQVVSQAEFLARRESVTRTMVVCERQREDSSSSITQVGVLEDDVLVEHLVANEAQASSIGNIYLGRVQNVLPSMEAVFIDIGTGRNAVLYASDVKWREQGLRGRQRTISNAFSSGDQVLVQVTKDPLGHKGARLTTHISLAGRYLVYVPEGRNAGISRKLPETERKRLKSILRKVVPDQGGAIIRTAAEGATEEAIATDVQRLHKMWLQIQQRAQEAMDAPKAKPITLYEEPNPLVRLIRDLFNEDFSALIVDGKRSWNTVQAYVKSVAPDLADRLERYDASAHEERPALEEYRIDEQLQKALSRKVWLPSGGTLVIDRTEAMTVIDVNTGKFTGGKNNLEATVTQNNLEAAEEIVRQMRLRDLGGMIVVDFIDMVLPENQDLVLRRLTEALGRDRTRHQISEVTSLGLVQITRKRLGVGLLETFSTPCPHCDGTGVIVHDYPVDFLDNQVGTHDHGVRHQDPQEHPAAVAMHSRDHDATDAAEDTAPQTDDAQDDAPQERKRGGKRRGDKKRGRAQQQQQDDSKLSFEELADAVIAPAVDATEEDTAGDQRAENQRRGKKRVPRRAESGEQSRESGRGAGKRREKRHGGAKVAEDTQDASQQLYDLVDEALDTAHQHDPDEPSGADYLPVAESYEEALEAYEASPRRQRALRGNSISDVPPKREDFAQAGASADATLADETEFEVLHLSKVEDPAQLPVAGPVLRRRRVQQTVAEEAPAAAKKQGRGRRAAKQEAAVEEATQDVVQATAQQDQPAQRERRTRRRRQESAGKAQAASQSAGTEQIAKAQNSEAQTDAQVAEQAPRVVRRRRKAQTASTQAVSPVQAEGAPQAAPAAQSENTPAPQSRGTRARRRVVSPAAPAQAVSEPASEQAAAQDVPQEQPAAEKKVARGQRKKAQGSKQQGVQKRAGTRRRRQTSAVEPSAPEQTASEAKKNADQRGEQRAAGQRRHRRSTRS